MARRKAPKLPERMVYFRCKNELCSFVGAGVTDKPYIRCTRCNKWSSIYANRITEEEYQAVWGGK